MPLAEQSRRVDREGYAAVLDAAAILGVSRNTLYNWRAAGSISFDERGVHVTELARVEQVLPERI